VSRDGHACPYRTRDESRATTGGGATDDLEMFERNQVGLSVQVDPWLLLARGRHREHQDMDGAVVGQITDELTQRASAAVEESDVPGGRSPDSPAWEQ